MNFYSRVVFCLSFVSVEAQSNMWSSCIGENEQPLPYRTGSYAFFSYNPDYFYNDNFEYRELVRIHGNPLCSSYTTTNYNGGGRSWAAWAVSDPCPIGYYAINYLYNEDPPVVCEPCIPGSYNSLKPANSHFSVNGNFQNSCNQWICNAGFYRSSVTADVSNDKCTSCPFNTYSTGTNDLRCTTCPKIYALSASKNNCSVGQYYVLSQFDCQITSCGYCTRKPSGVGYSTYFVLMDGVSSDSEVTDPSLSCYWAYCQQCTEPGMRRVYCGASPGNLASPGICIKCSNIATFNSYEIPTDFRYYLSGLYDVNGDCQTAPCLPCNAGYFNSGCPISGGSLNPQTCTKCNSAINTIQNSEYGVVAVGVYTQSADYCPVICSPGFYKKVKFASFECVKCPTSNVCPNKGFYTEYCNNNGIGETVCLKCPTSNFPSIYSAIWATSLPEFGTLSCQWDCQIKFYKSGGTCLPCDIVGLICQTGQYLKALCLNEQASSEPPTCTQCTTIPNSRFVGASVMVNQPQGCSFVCLDGFWLSAEQTCTAWTTKKNCPERKMWGGGSDIFDNSCIDCPDLPTKSLNDLKFQYSFPVLGGCAWTCQAGFYLENYQCKVCPSGKFKFESGDGPCTLCNVGFFQDKKDRPQYCDAIPDYSTETDDRSFFTCDQGREFINDPIFGYSCEPCSLNPLNLQSMSFAPNSCLSSAFLCNSGFYRGVGIAQNPNCIACPANIPNSVSLWQTTSSTVNTMTKNTCGNFPSCDDPYDELNLACPISCILGYYISSSRLNENSITNTLSCSLCADSTCTASQTPSLCRNGQTVNTCTSCSYSLSVGQVFVGTDSMCTWQCTYGYEITPFLAECQPCLEGAYKPLISNSACLSCARGYYNNLQAQSSCFQCFPGTYSHLTGLGVCLNCQAGTFSSAYGSTTCTACPQNTYGQFPTQTQCTQCPAALPFSSLGSTQCSLPPPPCPSGFYLNMNDINKCLGCISGVYCPGGLSTDNTNQMPLPCPWTSSPLALYSPPLSSQPSNCSQISPCLRLEESQIVRKCPANTGTRGYSQAPSAIWCHPNSGFYGFPGVIAQPCPQDHYCSLGITTISPIMCPSHIPYSQAMSTSISNCSSIMYHPCRPGYFLLPIVGGACYPCTESSYCPGIESQAEIIACPPGSTWYSPPLSKSFSDCTFKTIIPNTFTSCPINTATPKNSNGGGGDIFMASIFQCRAVAGFYFIPAYHTQGIVCPSGYYCPAATLIPILCPPKICTVNGSMQTANICPIQSSSILAECQPCPGQLIANAHYIAVDSCLFCCNAGYLLTQTTTALSCVTVTTTTNCPENMYVPFIDLTGCSVSIVACQSCPASITIGSAIVPLRLRLPMLQSGQLPTFGIGGCLLGCLPGYYYSNSICTACPAGKFRGGDISIDSYVSSCLNCDRGKYAYYDASTQCLQCSTWTIPAADDYCLNCTSWSSSTCLVCGQWSMPANGRTNCTCILGTQMSAPSIIDGSMSCTECPLGSITTQLGCEPCPPGRFCTNLMTPKVCPAGWYRGNPTSTCMPCLKGYFTSSPDSIQCIPCPPGTYSNIASATVCTLCPANTFLSAAGGFDISQCLSCSLAWVPSSVSPGGSGQCGCPTSTYFNGYECKQCTSICHKNATLSNSCLFGSIVDTSICTCNAGFAGDGILACSLCLNPNECVCARGSHYDFVDI